MHALNKDDLKNVWILDVFSPGPFESGHFESGRFESGPCILFPLICLIRAPPSLCAPYLLLPSYDSYSYLALLPSCAPYLLLVPYVLLTCSSLHMLNTRAWNFSLHVLHTCSSSLMCSIPAPPSWCAPYLLLHPDVLHTCPSFLMCSIPAHPSWCALYLLSNGKTSIVRYRTLSFFAFRLKKKECSLFFRDFKYKISIEPVRFTSILKSFKINQLFASLH